jgi:peptidoglycan/LPS O-acetylase OafA/YrhL
LQINEPTRGGLSQAGDRHSELDGRLYQLDGLRALAFLSVFVNHAFSVSLLWIGVDLFFVLSGFLITTILLKQRTEEGYFRVFYYRRFLRIFPPYYLFLVMVFVFYETNWQAHWYWYAFYLSNIREGFSCGHSVGVLVPMWSLAVEEQFYLLWPLFVYTLGPRGMLWFSLALIFAAPLTRFYLSGAPCTPVYFLLPCRVDLLAAGALLAIVRAQAPARFHAFSQRGLGWAVSCGVIFTTLAIAVPSFRLSARAVLFDTVGFTLIGGVMTGIVAYAIPARKGWIHRLLSHRVLVYLGTISYSMYLCHDLVIAHFRRMGFSMLSGALWSSVVVLVCCSISWFFFEKPIQSYKNRGWGSNVDTRKTMRSLSIAREKPLRSS